MAGGLDRVGCRWWEGWTGLAVGGGRAGQVHLLVEGGLDRVGCRWREGWPGLAVGGGRAGQGWL